MFSRLASALVITIVTMCAATAYAIPQLINYQGVLTDGGGTPIIVPTSVQFRIFDAAAGGAEQWTETQSVPPDAEGRFSVLLGSVTPIPDAALDQANAYLGLTISPDPEMTPRTRLVAVAYAFRPGTVDGATGGTISGDVAVTGGNIELDQSSATAGNILKSGSLFIHNRGGGNTFIGLSAGNLTITGTNNTGTGSQALGLNTTGFSNSAYGAFALASNTNGDLNSAYGRNALSSNTTGDNNSAYGSSALESNTTGFHNSAYGYSALTNNTTGFSNNAYGSNALLNNTTGGGNCAYGRFTLSNNTIGGNNTAFGNDALTANTIGTGNTAMGYNAEVSAGNLTNATVIGADATVNASNKIRLGNTLVTVIEGQVAYTFTSDENMKENFRPVVGAEVLKKIGDLDLTSWNYKGQDPQQFRHYGPMAQEFFAAFGKDDVGTSGTPTTINSGDQVGILMIAVQALSKDKERLTQTVETMQSQIAELREMIRAQATQPK